MIIHPPKIVGKQRPRYSRGRWYTPTATVEFEGLVKEAYEAQDKILHDGLVSVEIEITQELPKSAAKKRLGERGGKPDIDNVCKAVLDALNGVAYKDDSQVVELHVIKRGKVAHGEGNTLRVRVRRCE